MLVRDYYDLDKGANCHMRHEGAVPICVVTSLNHNEILLTSQPAASDWVVSGCIIYLQRFWSTSTATLTLSTDLSNLDDLPPYLPKYGKVPTGTDNRHRLQPEDGICVYMGYVSDLSVPITSALMEGDSPNLLRVYTGVIDTLKVTSTPQGTSLSIQCRDRMRYLMDTAVCLSPFDVRRDDPDNKQLQERRSQINKALSSSGVSEADNQVFRSDVIVRLAQMGVGYVDLGAKGLNDTDVNINGLVIDYGDIQDLGELKNKKVEAKDFKGPDYFYNTGKKPLRAKTSNSNLDLDQNIKFNAIVGRLPFSTETVAKEFTIEQGIPVEFIKFLANQEPYPIEVFSNHQDGEYYYTPRKNDASGLTDPKRFFRTYYHRVVPNGVGDKDTLEKLQGTYPPESIKIGDETVVSDYVNPFTSIDRNQMTINYQEEFSSLAVKTNYIVANTSPTSPVQASIIMHLAARPAFLRGVSMGGRNMYVIDETISNATEGAAVALSMAKIHSKELKAASTVILGDPSIVPGEVIQLVGSALRPETIDLDVLVQERKVYYDFENKDNLNYIDTLDKLRSATQEDSAKSLHVLGTDLPAPSQTDIEKQQQPYGLRPKLIKQLKSSLDVLSDTKNFTLIAPYDAANDPKVSNPSKIDTNAALNNNVAQAATVMDVTTTGNAAVNSGAARKVLLGNTIRYTPFKIQGNVFAVSESKYSIGSQPFINKILDMPLHHLGGYRKQFDTILGRTETVANRSNLVVYDLLLSVNSNREVPVPSPVAGLVEAAFFDSSSPAGNFIQIVDVRGKIISRIMHFSRLAVKSGDFVQYGQTLGTQGKTGVPSTAGIGLTPHAHTELSSELWNKYFNDLLSGTFTTTPTVASVWGEAGIASVTPVQSGLGNLMDSFIKKNLTNPPEAPKPNKDSRSSVDNIGVLVASSDLQGLGITFPHGVTKIASSIVSGNETIQEQVDTSPIPSQDTLIPNIFKAFGLGNVTGFDPIIKNKSSAIRPISGNDANAIKNLKEQLVKQKALVSNFKKELQKPSLTSADKKDIQDNIRNYESSIINFQKDLDRLVSSTSISKPTPAAISIPVTGTPTSKTQTSNKQEEYTKTAKVDPTGENTAKAKKDVVDDALLNSATKSVSPLTTTKDAPWRNSGFLQEPKTLWRVEGVKHQFNAGGQIGWTTELALLSVFS